MTETQLIEGILSKQEKYFEELVNRFQPLVLNTCNSFLHNRTDAEDISQEVFIEAFLSLHKFKKESKLSTWLYRIAVNKSLNFIRDNKKRKIIRSIEVFFGGEPKHKLQLADPGLEDAGDLADEEEKMALLHRAVASLPKNQRVAFTLSKFEKLSYVEIADVMELSLASVEGLIHRAKRNVTKKILSHYQKKIA
ncbi:MAG: RNA polymerase sigma factor [Bacteroidetes bacterium]|nr:RNA polymerase sigma factor [Bacteroidota bacterium]MBU1579871.1 RNA polymerase sigma factor [Bacteroidota bacterium]MBU2466142.1 RNA polymerase sigma factor [Bacteroidota bacterium]MBU2556900.1 RNA polymerase sigma factor [Bacteroidota bacterium]